MTVEEDAAAAMTTKAPMSGGMDDAAVTEADVANGTLVPPDHGYGTGAYFLFVIISITFICKYLLIFKY